MINFIIYEDEKETRKMFKDIILKVIGTNNEKYKDGGIQSYYDYERFSVDFDRNII